MKRTGFNTGDRGHSTEYCSTLASPQRNGGYELICEGVGNTNTTSGLGDAERIYK